MANLFFSNSPEKAIKSVSKTRLSSYLNEEALAEIHRAFLFAEKAHRGQTRKSGEHYIHHPIAVASTLAEQKMDAQTIAAALLHDVIEDTDISKDDIAEQFGEDVAHLVDGVSKINQVQFDSKEQAEAANFRKMLLAMSSDVRVIIIKLADRLHNMRTLEVMRREKKVRISRQTLEVYAPIAERLGLYEWSRELQNLSFQHIRPNRHKTLSKALQVLQGNRKRVVDKLKSSLATILKNAELTGFEVKGRRKSVYSIYKKMQNKKQSFKELHDIYGFRIIVSNVDDCYRTLGLVHNAYKPIPGRFEDYIAIPKENGYQSLHTIVFGPFGDNVEVQIRTKEMDYVAEAGVAAHWVYKTGDEVSSSNHLARQWLLDLLDPSHQTGSPVEFLEHLKADLYPDEVYVFTPKGDIKKLPRGATALDFAYSVHSDIGMRCTGARVNRVLVPLPTQLKNGDRVEIITTKQSRPNTTWLNYAVTAKARTQIRHFLKHQKRDDALKLGKRLLGGTLKQRFFSRPKVDTHVQQQLLQKLELSHWDELLVDIGLGKRIPRMVAKQIAKLSGEEDTPEDKLGTESLQIKGAEGLLVTYSKCCLPISGDPIIGTFTQGHGLVIHMSDCPNIISLYKQPERTLLVDWDEQVDALFHARLRVKMEAVAGDFAMVATAIAENDSNIIHVDLTETLEKFRQIDFIIEVVDRTHLAQIIKAIRKLPHVVKVFRNIG